MQSKPAMALYKFLKPYLEKPLDEWPAKVSAWQKIYKDETYDDVSIRHLSSYLNKLCLEFIGINKWQNDADEYDLTLLPELHRRNLSLHFTSLERNFNKRLETSGRRDTVYYLNQFRYERIRRLVLEQDGVKRTTDLNLSEINFNLDVFYIQHKLKLHCDALNYKNFLNVEIDIAPMEGLLENLESSPYYELPAIKIYHTIYKTLTGQEEERHFLLLLPLLREFGNIFDPDELDTIYVFTQNFCIKKINQGTITYYARLFEIYKDQIEQGLLLRDGELAPWHYKNIVTVGSQIGEFEWTEYFIHEYNHYLPANYRESAFSYNKARLEFSRKNYGKVVELLREVEYHDIFYALSARWMLLKTFWELEEDKALDALLESFRIYLRRNEKVSTQLKQQYSNMLRTISRLLRVNPHDKEQVKIFRKDVEQNKSLSDKHWFLQKIEEL